MEENIRELKRLEQIGVKTVLCSGRQINAIKYYKTLAHTSQFIISTNGAEIYDCNTNASLYLRNISKKDTFTLYSLAEELDLLIKIDTPYFRFINDMKYAALEEIQLNNNIKEFVTNNNIIQISLGHKDEKIIDNLISKLDNYSNIRVANKFLFNKQKNKDQIWIINIVESTVSKGNAIKQLCNILNVNISDTIAFGDDLNDLSMLQTVGYGVAMGNSCEKLKKVAKEIITDNNTPGIASILHKLI